MPAASKAQQQAAGAALAAKKKGKTAGLKGASKQMAKMGKAELEKIASTKHKGLKKHVKESIEEKNLNEAALANNVTFWVVEKSKNPGDNPLDLVFETDPIGFANQIRGGLIPESVHGFYLEESEAYDAAHDLVTAVFEAAKAMEEKKEMVTKKVEEVIKKLQEKVNRCMEEGLDEEAQMHLQKISELRSKSQMVEASKKPMEEVSYDKSGLKNPKKADLNKNKDISGYEKKRGEAVEKSMKK